MITAHFNHNYQSGIPIGVADRYYAQDLSRDFWHNLERAGRALYDFYGQSNILVSGGQVSQGSSVTKINVTAAVALGPYTVTVPLSFSALPPTTQNLTLPAVLIDLPAQTDFNLVTAGATLDGVTVNYLKLAYAEAAGNTRSYAKKSGTYAYESVPSFILTCTSVAPTSNEVLLAKLTGNGSSTLTITKQVMPKNAQTLKDQVCPVGTYRFEPAYNQPSEQFPWLCLDDVAQISGSKTVNTTAWDDTFIAYLRGYATCYREGTGFSQSVFNISNWSITSNVVTLTMNVANPGTKAFMLAMVEAQLAYGGYSNWMCVTLPASVGTITAGDYAITVISSTQFSFAFTASNGSGAGSWNLNCYPFRVAGSATSARIYGGSGIALMSTNDTNDLLFPGVPSRFRSQGHIHGTSSRSDLSAGGGVQVLITGGGTGTVTGVPLSDGTNNTPLTGPITNPSTLPGHLYMFGRTYKL